MFSIISHGIAFVGGIVAAVSYPTVAAVVAAKAKSLYGAVKAKLGA